MLGSAILPPSWFPKQNPMFPYIVLSCVSLCFQPVSALHPDLSPLYCTSLYFTFFTSVHLSISHLSPVPPIFLSVHLDFPQCHRGRPLVGFPSVSAFNLNDHQLAIWLVPTGLEPLTGLLGLVGYLRVVSWSIGKAGGGSRDGLHGHRVKDTLATYI